MSDYKTYEVRVHGNGHKEWFLNGKLHREDGPAVEYADGRKEWHLNGKEYSIIGFQKLSKKEKASLRPQSPTPPKPPPEFKKTSEIIEEIVKKVINKYVVYPKKGGKRLGTHKTKKAAQKQLAAIEISKAQGGR